jgi:hypothetical protein
VTQAIEVSRAAPTRLLAERWAVHRIAQLEAGDADKAEIVATSKDFGVMSKHTSLLVLESEEAYRQHGIERRRGPEAQALRQVTGGDLDSLSRGPARLSPDEIQPGDPEISIPAPADARQVVVVFPFGDTKLARFDADRNAWITRFLIDKGTPDGAYHVLVHITHADGRVESLRLPYFVDTQAPTVTLSVRPVARGGFAITVTPVVAAAPMTGADAQDAGLARIREEIARVELYAPDGRIVNLRPIRGGRFARTWRPSAPLAGPVSLRIVATDAALNQQVVEIEIGPDGAVSAPRVIDDGSAPGPSDALGADDANGATDAGDAGDASDGASDDSDGDVDMTGVGDLLRVRNADSAAAQSGRGVQGARQ